VTFLKGTEPNELSWSVAKLEVSDDAGVPADCKYKYLFGLVALQRELQSCGGETSSKDERYSNTDECKALLGQGSTVLCNTCRDTGAAIATIETVMMMLGIFAGITIVFRMCDQNKEDPLKHFIVTLLLTGVTIGLFVAWVLWLSTCHQEIRIHIMNIQNTQVLDGPALGDAKAVGVSSGFSLALVSMFFALFATFNEYRIALYGMDAPAQAKKEDVEIGEHKNKEERKVSI